MTAPQQIKEFLLRSPGIAFCTDCLTDLLNLNDREQARYSTAGLANTEGFQREKAMCSRCNKIKLVIRAT